jgi:hypothetical protein
MKKRWIAAVLLLILGCWIAFAATRPPDIGEHAARVDWLPEYATDVSWHRSYFFTAYEFSVSEEQFFKWLDERGVERKSLTAVTAASSRRLPRYNRRIPVAVSTIQDVTITDGWFWEYRQSNGGGRTFAYDRATQRAYYHTTPR